MNSFKMLTGKPIGKIPLGRPRSRWEDNLRMDLKTIDVNTRKNRWEDDIRMDVKEIGVSMKNELIRLSYRDCSRALVKRSIPGTISYGITTTSTSHITR